MIPAAPWGFRDILPEEALAREKICRTVADCLASRGYEPVETPLLEVRDTLEQGGRITDTPFSLVDGDGRLLAVRPDLTLPIIRALSARMGAGTIGSAGAPAGAEAPADAAAGSGALPLRLRYQAPVVREQRRFAGKARQFTQVGFELVGEGSQAGDGEVVSLAATVVERLGIPAWRIVCGSVAPLNALLDRVGDAALAADVLAFIHDNNLVDLDERLAASGLPESLACALSELPRLCGSAEVLDRADELLAAAGAEPATAELRALLAEMGERGDAGRITFDFSILNSFDYYTGLVFKAYSDDVSECLGSGGRYDGAFDAYGISLPAAGFAFSLERLEDALALTPAAAAESLSSAPSAPAPSAPSGEGTLACAERPLRVAVPKGSLNKGALAVLAAAGLDVSALESPGRHLIFRVGEGPAAVEFIIVRATDAPAFVACGGADCGICGRDSLIEADLGASLLQLVDLRFGACRFIEAEPASRAGAAERAYARRGTLRVATKYPRIAAGFYERRGIRADIVTLHGNIELAPIVGMTDRIVDITATGTTLRENDLVVTGEILPCTARFFVNVSRARCDERVRALADAVACAVESLPEEVLSL